MRHRGGDVHRLGDQLLEPVHNLQVLLPVLVPQELPTPAPLVHVVQSVAVRAGEAARAVVLASLVRQIREMDRRTRGLQVRHRASVTPRPAGNATEVDGLAHRYFPGATRSPWVATATIPQRRHTQTWTIPPKSVTVEGRDLIRSTWLHLAQAGAVMYSSTDAQPEALLDRRDELLADLGLHRLPVPAGLASDRRDHVPELLQHFHLSHSFLLIDRGHGPRHRLLGCRDACVRPAGPPMARLPCTLPCTLQGRNVEGY